MPRQITVFVVLLTMLGCSLPSGVPDTEQFRSIQSRARAGDVESQYQLGMQYTLNDQSVWGRISGYRWFAEAAAQGHADAQYMVGMGKLLGRGTLHDKEGAVHSFRLAAEQGQERAQYQLGLAYLNGAGVNKDQAWGRQWLEQAAWNGHSEAQFILGALFAKGVGGQVNLAEAWRWLENSRQGDQARAANALKLLQVRMTAHDRRAGERLLGQQPGLGPNGLYLAPMVRYAQNILSRLGYQVGVQDGVSGPLTQTAIRSYVEDNKMPREIHMVQLVESLRGEY